ncbi:MAG: TIGR02444 family protein [Rhodovibrionaceae bacterium]
MPDAASPKPEKPAEVRFWDFSLAAYAKPGVAPACLALQERHGLDVNLLLYCGWSGRRGRRLGREELAALDAKVAAWRSEVVLPLRGVRRWMKTQETAPGEQAQALREEIKRLELEAERIEQDLLSASAEESAGEASPQAAASNMRLYLGFLGAEISITDIADLAAVLTGCFGEVPPLEAVWLFED